MKINLKQSEQNEHVTAALQELEKLDKALVNMQNQ